MCALPNPFRISSHSSRSPWFRQFRTPPQTQMGVGNGGAVGKVEKIGKSGWRFGRDWEEIGLGFRPCSHSSQPLPTIPALSGFGSFVFRPKPNWGWGSGRSGEGWERAGRAWSPIPIYVHSSQCLPNLFPFFPVSKFSVVSYSTPNPDGRRDWGAVGKVGKRGNRGKRGRNGESGKSGRSGQSGKSGNSRNIGQRGQGG